MKFNITTIAALTIATLLASTSNAADISYKILIDGVDADSHKLAPGTYTLEVQGSVTDNEVVPNTPGGFIQASFDLLKDNDSVAFVQGLNFLNQPNGLWDSTSNDAFANHNAGAVDASGNIIQETGSILQSDWDQRFNEVGTGVYSFIASGDFEYDGNADTTITLRSVADINLVAALNGGNIGAGLPDGDVLGDTALIQPIPEPTALALAGLGLVGFVARRRRS